MLNTNLFKNFKKIIIILSPNLIDIVLNGVEKIKYDRQRGRKEEISPNLDVYLVQPSLHNSTQSLFKIGSPLT